MITISQGNREAKLTHTPTEVSSPIVPKSNNFLDFDPLEVARQLTLIEQSLYRYPSTCSM
jgi:hypothetical protein